MDKKQDEIQADAFMASTNECTGILPFSSGEDIEAFAELYSEIYGFPSLKVDIKIKDKLNNEAKQ